MQQFIVFSNCFLATYYFNTLGILPFIKGLFLAQIMHLWFHLGDFMKSKIFWYTCVNSLFKGLITLFLYENLAS